MATPAQGNVPPDFLYRQLNKFPRGLLKYFGIPQGQNPQLLESTYQPVLDLWEWIASTPENQIVAVGSGVAIGGGIAGTVNLLSLFRFSYVLEYTIRTQPIPAGGGDFAMVPTIQPNVTTGVELAVGPPVRTVRLGAATVGEVVVARSERPFFFGLPESSGVPRSILGAIVTAAGVAGAFQAFGYIRYVALDEPF